MGAIEDTYYKSWHDFKKNLFEDLFADGIFKEREYLFRGQFSPDWALIASYDRFGYPIETYSDLLEMFKEECKSLGVELEIVNNMHALMSFAQHYGIPTRLLDWSYSPYIASLFAYSDLMLPFIRDEAGIPQKHVVVWVLNKKSSFWEECDDLTLRDGLTVIDTPRIGNVRVRNQNGCFTYLSHPNYRSLEEHIHAHWQESSPWVLRRCYLPLEDNVKAIPDLIAMGINWGRIFPGIDGSAKETFLNWKCKHFNIGT